MSKNRLKQKLAQTNAKSIGDDLNTLSTFNHESNWSKSRLELVDEIVQRLSKGSIIGQEAYNVIQTLCHYDNALVSRSILSDSDRRECSSKIENLAKLYKALLIKRYANQMGDSNEYIQHSFEKEAFILLKTLPEVLEFKGFGNAIVELIFTHNLTSSSAHKVIKFCNVDIKKLKWPSRLHIEQTIEDLKSVTFITQSLLRMWDTDPQRASELLSFFVGQGLSLNESSLEENAINIVFSEASDTNVNLALVEELLQHGADLNVRLRGRMNVPTFLFGIAVGKGSVEAVQLLLNYGANPYLSGQDFKNIYGDVDANRYVLASFGLDCVMPDRNDRCIYFAKVHKLIEQTLLERALGIAPKPLYVQRKAALGEVVASSDNSVQDDWGVGTSAPKKNQTQTKKKKLKDQKHKAVKIKDAKPTEEDSQNQNSELDDRKISGDDVSPANITVNSQALEDYMAYKENVQYDASLSDVERLISQFDLLLLRNDTEGLSRLLEENPELHGYSITSLLESNTSCDQASEVLAHAPTLLNKFYNLKKKSNIGAFVPKDADIVLGRGVYEVQSMFDKKVFIKVSDEMMDNLGLDNDSKLQKLKIISAKSKGENGVKIYKNSIKLKLSQDDKAAYATKQYIDANGDIFIEFDELQNHNWCSNRGEKLEVIKLTKEQFDGLVYNNAESDFSDSHANIGMDHHYIHFEEKFDDVDVIGSDI